MSKALPATCVAGVVMAGVPPLPLPTATILSQGVAASQGVAILDGDDAHYLPNVTPDLLTTLQQVVLALTNVKTALDNVATALTLIDAKPTGGTASASTPLAATNITAITTASTAVGTVKQTLDTLTEAML